MRSHRRVQSLIGKFGFARAYDSVRHEEVWNATCMLAWADDFYAFATNMDAMESMITRFQDVAQRMIGLVLRPERCKWWMVHRQDGPEPSARGPTPVLDSMQQLRAGECLRVPKSRSTSGMGESSACSFRVCGRVTMRNDHSG